MTRAVKGRRRAMSRRRPHFTPDCMNARRAGWAAEAVMVFCTEVGLDPMQEPREAFHDLVCDLGHYADCVGLDFRAQLTAAVATWLEEKADPAENGEWEVQS